MKIEKWCGHEIRFVELKGEWWAFAKDICNALEMDENALNICVGKDMTALWNDEGVWERVINEEGIYVALFSSDKLEAQKFRLWSLEVLRKLRKAVGLEGYQALRMTNEDIQDEIDHILDTLYWDEERKCIMQSVTVQGGDVEQVPFE